MERGAAIARVKGDGEAGEPAGEALDARRFGSWGIGVRRAKIEDAGKDCVFPRHPILRNGPGEELRAVAVRRIVS